MSINADGTNDPVESKETAAHNPNLDRKEPVIADQHPKPRNERDEPGDFVPSTDK